VGESEGTRFILTHSHTLVIVVDQCDLSVKRDMMVRRHFSMISTSNVKQHENLLSFFSLDAQLGMYRRIIFFATSDEPCLSLIHRTTKSDEKKKNSILIQH
jgi:hypothetical protein